MPPATSSGSNGSSAVKHGAAAASADVAAALTRLQSSLNSLAPKLYPSSAPISFSSSPEVLDRLYSREEAKSRLQSLETKAKKASCEICGGALRDASWTSWSLEWEVDVVKRRMAPSRCQLICDKCESIRDLPRLIKRLSFGEDAVAAGSELLRHFLAVNGHDAAESHLLQDAVSVSHAMLVLHKELRLALSRGPPLEVLLQDVGSEAGKRSLNKADSDEALGGGQGNSEPPMKKRKGKKPS